jgi:hypothetical protein
MFPTISRSDKLCQVAPIQRHVDGKVDLEGATVADKQTFDAGRLHVALDFFPRSTTSHGTGNV